MITDRLKVAVLSAAHRHAVGYCRHLQRRGDVEVVLTDPDATSGPEGPRGRDLADELGIDTPTAMPTPWPGVRSRPWSAPR
ncbi:MAG: hypothetical protein ACR2I1_03120, partial [Propionibacteriaceae bacterium]